MDLMTILGLLVGGGAMFYVMWTGNVVNLLFNVEAAVLVFGGTFGCTLITYPWKIIKVTPRAVLMMIIPPKRILPDAAINLLVKLAEKAKRSGVESLQSDLAGLEVPFLRDSLQMIIDGLEAETVHEKLEKELAIVRRRHYQVSSVFRSMGGYAPIFGLLGTLLGVVQVLRNLTDAQGMGASMAIAVTATFYGIFGANFIFLPIAGKLTIYSEDELIIKELITRGVLAIQKGEVPLVVERKLEAFLAYRLRATVKPAEKGKK
ncbi:MAG: MotA/TolQ/ExbB proton channel family protein [Endomicrobiales bacterium]|nr:MotA/TolQ/ExbB proton channel family protein [Endomicrobiales bacterium]